MAAAMLPLLWPSFQLAGAPARSARSSPPAPDKAAIWSSISYTQLSRASSSPAPLLNETSSIAPAGGSSTNTTEIVSTTTTVSTGTSSPVAIGPTTPLPPRRKKRKPIYLLSNDGRPPANQLSLPDSTRLASKYALPRIKFSGAKSSVKQSLNDKLLVEQLPVGLSKLIESQIQVNTSSLLRFNNSNARAGPAPTTSVSKTVRIRSNNTSDVKVALISLSAGKELELKRQNIMSSTSTTTPAPVTTPRSVTGPPTSLRPTLRSLSTSSATPVTMASEAISSAPMTTSIQPPSVTADARSTEPGDPYKSLPTPRAVDEQQLGSNNIAEIDEDPIKVANKRGQLAGRGPKATTSKQPAKQMQSQSGAGWQRSNIKLFHFKRKPDMNKLPFYKRPLNYTELGWTTEQIQEHLDSLVVSGGDQSVGQADESVQHEQGAAEAQLLKRKRRGKSQFERLLAELHGDQQTDTEQAPNAHSDLVPVMKKKAEPIVVKPVFTVMNQKTRNRATSSEAPSLASSTTASSVEKQVELASGDAMPQSLILDKDKDGDDTTSSAHNKSKPIIRMRRKHHGEQPSAAFIATQLDRQPWRPSKPLIWSPLSSQVPRASASPDAMRLLLLPSSLLTPSGSHLVPFYAHHSGPASPPPVTSWQSVASNEGWSVPIEGTSSLLAEEKASARQPVSNPPKPAAPESQPLPPVAQQKVQQAASSTSGELRVPKLLVKPMRPAKYSLNGYIPKPSLNQQAQQVSHPELAASSGNHSHQGGALSEQTGAQQVARVSTQTKPTGRQTAGRPGSQQGSFLASSNGKDLVSVHSLSLLTFSPAWRTQRWAVSRSTASRLASQQDLSSTINKTLLWQTRVKG